MYWAGIVAGAGEEVTKCKTPVLGGLPVTREDRCLNKEPTSWEQMSSYHKDKELASLNPEAKVGRPMGD